MARMDESADARRILTAVPSEQFPTSVWKMPLSWHWTDHSGGYWQQVELHTELLQAEQ